MPQCLQTRLATSDGLIVCARAYRRLFAGDAMIKGMGIEGTGIDCRECLAGRPHCHGTLIHHPGQSPHCTEPDCHHPEVLLHSLTVDCEAIGCDCDEQGGYWVAI